jgi:signal transduction histidine kinase
LAEVNANLIIAALAAQELSLEARAAQHRQIEWVAMVAHELRSPLASMRIVAGLIKHSRADEVLAERLQVIIQDQTACMSRVVDDLLERVRTGSGVFRLERSRFDVIEAIQRAVQTCRPTIEQRTQHFQMTLPQDPVYVNGDPLRLTQVVSNLLDNASRYTGAGGEIVLAMTVCKTSLALTISDNGIGIAPEALPGIFDVFVQETRAHPLHSGGLSVGLAIVRNLVEAHGGTVVGQSAGTDCGSAFVVTLPVLDLHSVPTDLSEKKEYAYNTDNPLVIQ